MGGYWMGRYGFRWVYHHYGGSDDWYEERCLLFKYRSVNFLFVNGGEIVIDRLGRRCHRCVYYPICFRKEILEEKFKERFGMGLVMAGASDDPDLKRWSRFWEMLITLNEADESEAG